jgi:hypothetical protein
MDNNRNNEKNRKSEAQKHFEEADNAGRFAGNDNDAKAARERAMENIKQDTSSGREERNQGNQDSIIGDAEARRDGAQSHDYKGEAQNVNIDPEDRGRLGGNDKDVEHARNKAMQGINEGRDTGSSGNTDMNRGNIDQKGNS